MHGWRRSAFTMVLGVFLALAMPPLFAFPLVVVSLTGLAWVLDGAANWRRLFMDGWMFGIGFFGFGYHWIANSLLVDLASHGWMYPFALVAIGAGFGVFIGLVALPLAFSRPGHPRTILLAISWLFFEWVRCWILTGFPWNLLGLSLAFSDELIQSAAIGGPWLTTVIVIVCGLFPALICPSSGFRRRHAFIGFTGVVVVLAVTWVAGAQRLSVPVGSTTTTLRLVQPAIDQSEKWIPERLEAHFATQYALSSLASGEARDVIVWPEAAIPYSLQRRPEIHNQLAALANEDGIVVVGAIRAGTDENNVRRPLNSVLVFDRGGLGTVYDKRKLVPFGEYVPLADYLPIDQLVSGSGGFLTGPEHPPLVSVGTVPSFAVLICYEIIFPSLMPSVDNRPHWLLTISNDAWFGAFTGPYQHFEIARMRAVELGLPVIRVSNPGVSGVIDAYGRVLEHLPLGYRGVLDHDLPARIAPTLYARIGETSLVVLLLIGAVSYAAARVVSNRTAGNR